MKPIKQTRRQFIKITGLASAALMLPWKGTFRQALAVAIPGGTLDPTAVPKYQTPLLIPPVMPRSTKLNTKMDKNIDYYEIAVRQFQQQILPAGLPMTKVWGYGSLAAPGTVAQGGSFNYPAFTLENKWNRHTRVKWVNDLVDESGNPLPHLFAVDQTLHWANPPGGEVARDTRSLDPAPYLGPVPLVTHVHGAHTHEDSDGYPEAWYLPDALNIPASYAKGGTWYDDFAAEFLARTGEEWTPGSATFEYSNDMRATTLWYHDHTLGMTRLNVYAGPAGFFILRGGPDDLVLDRKGKPAVLPGPAPALGDAPGTKYYEIPILVQDRSFNADGSLFYPDNRAFFEGLEPEQLQVPFIPDDGCTGPSDVSPIWNPEFFANTMVVNGNTWPVLEVEPRRYRFRLLNGCNSRFLILKMTTADPESLDAEAVADADLPFWQIGADGGFLATPAQLSQILMAPAERADVIVDFSNVPAGTEIYLTNEGPDEPFGGGTPGVDFEISDAATTRQVMKFVVGSGKSKDPSTPPDELVLPAIVPLIDQVDSVRQVSLNEEVSATVRAWEDEDENMVGDCDADEPFGPTAAKLGVLDEDGNGVPLLWMDGVTEAPIAGTTEAWEIFNFTADAHPIHVHLVQFQVVNRQGLAVNEEGEAVQPAALDGTPRAPEPGETGFKDTVIAYPGEVTRIIAKFDKPGLYVWHCHIVEHEDNEMMRPYRILPPQP